MVEYGSGPVKEGINNLVFIIPGIITALLVGFFAFRLYKSLRDRERAKADKKRIKQGRKDKDPKAKQKKK